MMTTPSGFSPPCAPWGESSWGDPQPKDVRYRNPSSISLVLYEPEIPGNTGTLLRLSACWGMPLIVIEPLGFVLSDRRFRRAVLDYEYPTIHRFPSWKAFWDSLDPTARTIAVVPQNACMRLDRSLFHPGDYLIMGSEQGGLPHSIQEQCHTSVSIPMMPGCRSMNLATAAAVVWAEALRQVNGFPVSDM